MTFIAARIVAAKEGGRGVSQPSIAAIAVACKDLRTCEIVSDIAEQQALLNGGNGKNQFHLGAVGANISGSEPTCGE